LGSDGGIEIRIARGAAADNAAGISGQIGGLAAAVNE
jgi:hypothetical protein